MSKFRREEDEADKWLREHDPYYTSSDRDKRKKMSNPYETPEQERCGEIYDHENAAGPDRADKGQLYY